MLVFYSLELFVIENVRQQCFFPHYNMIFFLNVFFMLIWNGVFDMLSLISCQSCKMDEAVDGQRSGVRIKVIMPGVLSAWCSGFRQVLGTSGMFCDRKNYKS